MQQPAGSASARSLGKGGRQVSWRGSQEGTYWIRLKSPSCPISKHRQQQMLRSTSVSHAQKRRKVLRNMKKKKACLPRSLKGKKKNQTHHPNPKKPPAAQKNSNPPKPPGPHLSANGSGMRNTRFQHVLSQPTAVLDRRRWGLPEDQGLLRQLLLPLRQMGEQQRGSLHPSAPSLGTRYIRVPQMD